MMGIPYLAAIGSLMYASMGTRPDITFAVQHLSQFSSNPGMAHWTAAQRVIRYLNTTKVAKLTLGGRQPIILRGWTDADWAANTDDRKSISGYAFTLGSGAISWSAKKQPTVATSSCEAEYIACDHATKEAMWLWALLRALGQSVSTATKLKFTPEMKTQVYCDNQGTISLTKDSSFHARSKHIDVKHHYICERVAAGDIYFEYLPTSEMVADVLTKSLPRPKHEKFSRSLGLEDPTKGDKYIPASVEGEC